MKAKGRIVLVGWKDPMVYQLECAAPTPTQEAMMVTLQWFREGVSRLPQGVTHPSVGPGQLLLVETEIYGLVSGPS